jgi:hypothetical protein
LHASHILGGEVTYRHLGGLKYEIAVKLYRDCRGVPLNSPTCNMIGNGDTTKKKSLSLTRISIRDVTNYCKDSSKACSKENETISNSSPAQEEHLYKDTVDFNKADSAFKKYCVIWFGVGQCCRSGDITTGASNSDFWVYTELDICKAANNSSPYLSNVPFNFFCCNQPVYTNMGALDTLDHDSLSYSFSAPNTGWKTFVSYSGGKSSQGPFSDYWPSGYDKKKGPNPSANPPIGTYLDPETGDLIVTPTDCSEMTVAALKVTEWRKDSTGNYKKIGEVKRDLIYFTVTCPTNNVPTLNGPYRYDVCAGSKICFTVSSADKAYTPPPPGKAQPPDTITMTWNNGINKGATFNIVDTKAREKRGQFCWAPREEDASDLPYYFTVTVNDNKCPRSGITIKSYSVKVKKIARTKIVKKHINNGLYELKSELEKGFKGSPTYFWEIYDSTMKLVDTSSYFMSTGGLKSNRQLDSIQFYYGGKFIIHHRINNPPLNCPTDYYDTLKVAPVTPILTMRPNGFIEKWECQNRVDTLFPILRNAKNPVKFKWSSSSTDTLPYLIVDNKKESSYRVDVYDGAGFHRSAEWKINLYNEPKLQEKNDVSICNGDTVSISGTATNYTDTVYWKWLYNGNAFGANPKIEVTKTGLYTLQISDATKCFSNVDTINVSNMIVTSKVIEKMACHGDSVLLSDTASGIPGILYTKWFYGGTQIATGSTIRVFQRGKYTLELSDSNKCLTKRDTIDLSNMAINAVAGMVKKVCVGDTMMLFATGADTSGSNKGKYYWYVNSLSSSLVDSGSLVTYKFKADTTMIVKLLQTKGTLTCSDLDTLKVSFRPLPQIILSRSSVCQNETELDLHTIILKPTNSYKGIVNWRLLKTLKKPDGTDNSLTDLVYDKDTSGSDHYYLKVDKQTIDLKTKFIDSVMFGLTYKDKFGCQNFSSNDASIVIRSNVDVAFNANEQKRCFGDSLVYLSNDYGVNYYGGKWFTNNDSSNYLKWPQGNNVQLSEKLGTKTLDPKGGKYLLKYVLENNKCLSSRNAILSVVPYPAIIWTQTNQGDSIILTDKSNNSDRREWYINSKKMSDSSVFYLSKGDAKTKVIFLKVFNFSCESDSVIIPKIIGNTSKLSLTGFIISPNPVKNEIQINTTTKQSYKIEVINSLGQLVLKKSMSHTQETLDVSILPDGIYSIILKTPNAILVQKFIKTSD